MIWNVLRNFTPTRSIYMKSAVSTAVKTSIIVYLGDSFNSHHKLELTWLADRNAPYNLGDNEIHLAFTTKNFNEAHARHEKMGYICYENKAMGIYFIENPDGYWL